jgi:hypothetical protein
MTPRERARLGGLARARKLSAERRRAIGLKAGAAGGRAVLAKHGIDHFRELGRRGFAALVAKHYHGDRAAALADLHERGWRKGFAALAGAMSAAQLAEAINRVDVACDAYVAAYRDSAGPH